MWEGIGVASFLLISFWYTRVQAVKSAIQALTMNRVGDMMLSIGLFSMFALFGNLDYATVFSASPYANEVAITIIVLLLFIGATAKSAQVPLYVWLPGSMEGPTPVSALIHAATLIFCIYLFTIESSETSIFNSVAYALNFYCSSENNCSRSICLGFGLRTKRFSILVNIP